MLFLILALLIVQAVRVWTHPKYPATVDGSTVKTLPMTIPNLTLNRKPFNRNILSSITQNNLFRKERTEYIPPPPPEKEVQAVKGPTLPPPNLKLKGVMMLNSIKIAILEGEYHVLEGNNNVKKKAIKRKGYKMGEQIGEYEITEIERKMVTLDNRRGHILQVRLMERPPGKAILRRGNLIFHKDRNFSPLQIKAAEPVQPKVTPKPVKKPRLKPAAPPYPYKEVHISGKTVYVPAPRQHVSGG